MILAKFVQDVYKRQELMQAVDYIVQKAEMLQMPVSVNISFGNTYGAHNGTSLPERFLDAAAQIGRTLISVGTGNEGAEAGHTSGFVREGEETSVPLGVQAVSYTHLCLRRELRQNLFKGKDKRMGTLYTGSH